MAKDGVPREELAERVKQTLSRVRQECSSQLVFPPQFLARIKRVVVFDPLDQQAMVGIAERRLTRMQSLWRQKREKEITWDANVPMALGAKAHELNEIANGREGGRIVGRLVSDYVESRIQSLAESNRDEYKESPNIFVEATDPTSVEFTVNFGGVAV